ncbi:MAG: hypothetical protein FWG97_01885 [Deltaproteobacteria bacterium]|nr:hypothetical protein [Deltaproteobacteria bacterium]
MKKFIATIILVFMASIPAFAADPVTLRDNKNGVTVDLYPGAGDNYLFYGNNFVGYNVQFPHNYFTEVIHLPENGTGMILGSKDGARFSVTGGFVMDEENDDMKLRDSYEKALAAIGGENNASYYEFGHDRWEIWWREGDTSHRRKFVIKRGRGVWSDLEISEPFVEEGVVNPFATLLDYSFESLEFAEG